jgi:hypothetical protein
LADCRHKHSLSAGSGSAVGLSSVEPPVDSNSTPALPAGNRAALRAARQLTARGVDAPQTREPRTSHAPSLETRQRHAWQPRLAPGTLDPTRFSSQGGRRSSLPTKWGHTTGPTKEPSCLSGHDWEEPSPVEKPAS